MIRPVFVVLTLITLLPSTMATMTPRNEFSAQRLNGRLPLGKLLSASPEDRPYQVTERTEVMLDGRKCRYEKVPNSATIILMEIDSEDSRVILRIHFRSQKATARPVRK